MCTYLSTTSTNSQGRILLQFMERFNLTSSHLHKSDKLFSHTFESDVHSSVSTIDHILCPLHSLPRVQSAHPIDDHPLNTSDHLPVFAKLSANLPLPSSSPSSNQSTPCYPFSPRNWSKTPKEVVISKYTLPSGPRLSTILSNSPTLSTLQSQPKSIDSLLSDVSSCLLSCSRHIPPRKFHPAKQPGWDSALKLASKTCKSYYRSWVRAGRPRNPDNPLRMAYKAAKKLFRSHLRLRNKRLDNIFFNSLDTNLDPQGWGWWKSFYRCLVRGHKCREKGEREFPGSQNM